MDNDNRIEEVKEEVEEVVEEQISEDIVVSWAGPTLGWNVTEE